MKSIQLLAFALFLLYATVGHAEGNCPPSYYPIGASGGQAGPQGCAPIPDYDRSQSRGQMTLPPRWKSRWLAIVVDAPNGVMGTSVNAISREQAEQAAMSDCVSKGGTQCVLRLSQGNGCAALAAGKTGFNVHGAEDLEEAKALAMQTCMEATTGCAVYYAECSPPIRIQ